MNETKVGFISKTVSRKTVVELFLRFIKCFDDIININKNIYDSVLNDK